MSENETQALATLVGYANAFMVGLVFVGLVALALGA